MATFETSVYGSYQHCQSFQRVGILEIYKLAFLREAQIEDFAGARVVLPLTNARRILLKHPLPVVYSVLPVVSSVAAFVWRKTFPLQRKRQFLLYRQLV